MGAIWKGSIRFSLVNIPIALYPASRYEDLKFRLLRGSNLSPVNYKRVAEADGRREDICSSRFSLGCVRTKPPAR
jgi:DNA end-binding protein Ku